MKPVHPVSYLWCVAILLVTCQSVAKGQSDWLPQVGQQNTFTTQTDGIDTILPSNGNVFLRVPLLSYKEKGGLTLEFWLQGNSGSWHLTPFCGLAATCMGLDQMTNSVSLNSYGNETGDLSAPLALTSSLDVKGFNQTYAGVNWSPDENNCPPTGQSCFIQVSFTGLIQDSSGATHGLVLDADDGSLRSTDGSGYKLGASLASVTAGNLPSLGSTATRVIDPHGISYLEDTKSLSWTISDWNGNSIFRNSLEWDGTITDTFGRVIPDINSLVLQSDVTGCPAPLDSSQTTTASARWLVPGLNSQTETFLFCYTVVNVNTKFYNAADGPDSLPLDASGQFQAIQSVVRPDGESWEFSYDTVTATHSTAYGDLTKVKLPTGGVISYTFQNTPICGQIGRVLQTKMVDAGRGSTSEWDYSITDGAATVATVTDPLLNQTVYTYARPVNDVCPISETSRKYYQGSATSGVLLKQVATTTPEPPGYNPGSGPWMPWNFLPSEITTSTPAGSSTETLNYPLYAYVQIFSPYVNIYTNEIEDPPLPDSSAFVTRYELPQSTTLAGYAGETISSESNKFLSDPPWTETTNAKTAFTTYGGRNLMGLAYDVTLTDGGQTFESGFGYDDPSLSSGCICGSMTSKADVDPSGSLPANKTTVSRYNDGRIHTSTDPNSNGGQFTGGTTTYVYDSLNAYIQQAEQPSTGGVLHGTSAVRDTTTNLLESLTDDGGGSTTYSYIPVGKRYASRLQEISYPDGGIKHYEYADKPNYNSVTERFVLNSGMGLARNITTILDGLGRTTDVLVDDANCISGVTRSTTSYDPSGNISSVTEPTCDGASPSITSFAYDALGRKLTAVYPDSSREQWCFDGQQIISEQTVCASVAKSGLVGDWVDHADPSGLQSEQTFDAAGRLIGVWQPNVLTSYRYNVQNQLTTASVSSSGTVQNRSFVYDAFGRLQEATNVETGTVRYEQIGCLNLGTANPTCGVNVSAYDPNGNVLQKVDSRGIVTHYSYDALNRLVSKSYSTASTDPSVVAIATETPTTCYLFDTPVSSASGSFMRGRVSASWTQMGPCSAGKPPRTAITSTTVAAYDPMGRVLVKTECTPSNCAAGIPFVVQMSYDYSGQNTSYTDGTGLMAIRQDFDVFGRTVGLRSTWDDQTHPGSLFTVLESLPAGWTRSSLGSYMQSERTFDSRFRVTSQQTLRIPTQ